MTSKLTRERLQEIAEDGFLKHGESKELARMALVAMDSEPVKRVNADQMHHVCLEANRHLDKYGAMAKEVNKLLGRIPAQPAPVVSAELLHTAASAIEDLLTTKDRTGACMWFDLPFRLRSAANAQPAPVVPAVSDDIGEIRVGRLPTMNQDDYPGLGDWWVQLRIGEDSDEVLARVYGATPQEANNRAEALACRAAMLAAAPHDTPALNSVQSVVTGSDTWIQVSERMPEAEGHYLVWTNASRIDGYCDHLAIATYQGGGWSNEFNWLVTHWMPLPAGPQEVNYG